MIFLSRIFGASDRSCTFSAIEKVGSLQCQVLFPEVFFRRGFFYLRYLELQRHRLHRGIAIQNQGFALLAE